MSRLVRWAKFGYWFVIWIGICFLGVPIAWLVWLITGKGSPQSLLDWGVVKLDGALEQDVTV